MFRTMTEPTATAQQQQLQLRLLRARKAVEDVASEALKSAQIDETVIGGGAFSSNNPKHQQTNINRHFGDDQTNNDAAAAANNDHHHHHPSNSQGPTPSPMSLSEMHMTNDSVSPQVVKSCSEIGRKTVLKLIAWKPAACAALNNTISRELGLYLYCTGIFGIKH